MIARRLSSLLLAATITTSTCACGTTTTVDLQSDPESSEVRTRLHAGDPVEIRGYTRVSDGHRDWKGVIQLAPPDSVQFTARMKASSTTRGERPRRLEFRIARADLASIDIEGYDMVPVVHFPALVPVPLPEAQDPADADEPTPTISTEPSRAPISVTTTSPGGVSKRSRERALTIGIFVSVVGAVVAGYAMAGQ